jgi:endonuclease/exonuclease/phosphatase family metal-dependent hydrolase
MDEIHVLTYNIHKGYSRAGSTVAALREELRRHASDLVLLQEVQGLSHSRARQYRDWPVAPQYEYLADSLWPEFAYGHNAVYDDGHHGNAILSRFPIVRWANADLSQSRLEQRGLLHCEIAIPGWPVPVHCINVHLGLLAIWRRRQLAQLHDHIERLVPDASPLILAGDFNDWTDRARRVMGRILGLEEVFEQTGGRPALSFPARWPLLPLDRIYVRGLHVRATQIHRARCSDHLALSAWLGRA